MSTLIRKRDLFERMKTKGLFWSYSPNITYDTGKDALLCETVLKYADMNDIRELFELYDKDQVKQVWEQHVKPDARFKRLNYFLARVFFGMDIEASEFDGLEHARLAKFRLLAG